MKKQRLLIYLLLLCSNTIFSQQEWAPIGARWVQNIGIDFDSIPAPNPLLDYYVVECTGDSVINNLNFRKVGDYLMHQNGGKIYYWFGDSLNLVYDFEAEVGDTVNLNLLSCLGGVINLSVKVDSVGFIVVSGQTLKRVVTNSLPSDPFLHWFFPDGSYTYIEKIGRPHGVVIENLPPCVPILGYYPPWLRCYSDSGIDYKSPRFLSFGDFDCEYQPPTSVKETNQLTWSVGPNPTSGMISIQTNETVVEMRLFNPTGQCLLSKTLLQEKTLDISAFPSGVYWLQALGKEGRSLGVVKVILML